MDKLRCMEVMVAVVDAGSFAAAASRLQISAVMVGKHIQQLEAHLGARLLQRSTRRHSLTEVGAAFYEDSKRVLEQVRWAESSVERSRAAPQGLLRVSAPVTLGSHTIAPLVAQFLLRYPKVRVDLQLTDSVADLAGEGIDAAVRIGRIADESLVARPLRPYRMVIAAAPAYLQRHGSPQSAADLARHVCLSHSVWQRRTEWTLHEGSQSYQWPEQARLTCNHGDGLRRAAAPAVAAWTGTRRGGKAGRSSGGGLQGTTALSRLCTSGCCTLRAVPMAKKCSCTPSQGANHCMP